MKKYKKQCLVIGGKVKDDMLTIAPDSVKTQLQNQIKQTSSQIDSLVNAKVNSGVKEWTPTERVQYQQSKKNIGTPPPGYKPKVQKKSQGGQILGAAGGIASAIPGIGTIVGTGLGFAGSVVDMFAKKKEEERLLKEEQLLADKNAMAAMGTGLAKGGKIKGKGTGTSDSIPAKLEKGDFIVPAKNAETALKIRNEHFGDVENKATLKDGDVPVNVSNGEVRFTKDEMDYLDEIGEGSKVRSLAPNAEYAPKNAAKGKTDIPPRVIDPKLVPSGYRLVNGVLTKNDGTIAPVYKPLVSDKLKTTPVSTTSNYTPGPIPVPNKLTDYIPAMLGAGQAIAGLIQGGKNAKQERALQPVQSNAAIANSEAIDTKRTADQAANAIMAGNTAEADRAIGNYMRMAKEAGGANSATILANAARVGQSSSDAYLKGMTTAAQIKMAGQQAGSEMKIKAGEQATQTAMYNDQATRRLLEAKSANSNDLLRSGLDNASKAMASADFKKKMADLKTNVEHNLSGTKAITPTVNTTTPATTVTTPMNNTKPNIVSGISATKQLNITPEDYSSFGKNVPSKDNTPSQWDIENMDPMDRIKRTLYSAYGMKNGGVIRKYKKSKILSYGR